MARQIFEPRHDEQHAQWSAHEFFEDGVEMGAGGRIQSGEGLVEDEQPHRMREGACQLDSLPFAVGQRDQRAVEEACGLEQGDGSAHPPLEAGPCLPVPGSNLERVDVHHTFVGKVVAHERAAFLLQAVPARLDNRVVDFGFAVLEGDVADGLLGGQARRRLEVITQLTFHERQAPAQGVGQKRLARAVGAQNCPLLRAAEYPGGMLEDEAIPQPEGGIQQGQKRLRLVAVSRAHAVTGRGHPAPNAHCRQTEKWACLASRVSLSAAPMGQSTVFNLQNRPKSYPRATQELPKGYSRATQGLPKGYPRATQGLPKGNLRATRGTNRRTTP